MPIPDAEDLDAVWQEVRKQTRRAEVAEKRLNLLQKSLEETEDANIRLEAANLTLQSDNERLRALLIEAKAGVAVLSRPGVESGHQCSFSVELPQLQATYDLLLEEKKALSKKYHDDYIKWNQFKRYYKNSKRLRMKGNLRSPSRLSPRTRHHGALSSPSKARGWNTTPRKHGKVRESSQRDTLTLESPIISFSKEQEQHANEPNSTVPFEEMSFDDAISMVAGGSSLEKPSQHGNSSFSGTRSAKRRRIDPRSAGEIPFIGTVVPASVQHSSASNPSRHLSVSASASEPSNRPKGRGRYAQSAATLLPPLTSPRRQFNGDHGKIQRNQLHAEDCPCCEEYYKAIGRMPDRLQAPLWKSPTSTRSNRVSHLMSHDDKESENAQAHKQQISRHRHTYKPPQTPPGYWSIGFPDTQEAEQINRQALHRPS